MFKTALLSCFLVSLNCVNCMSSNAIQSEEKEQTAITNIKVEKIEQSELSMVTIRFEMKDGVKQNGFVSETSSTSVTARSFKDLQEFEKICKELKVTLRNSDTKKVTVNINVKTSFDTADIYMILNKYFNCTEDSKTPKQLYKNSSFALPFAVNTKEDKIDEKPEPCGLFATKINKETSISPVENKKRAYHRRSAYRDMPYEESEQNYKTVYEISWEVPNSDKNTELLGKLLSQLLRRYTNQRVFCTVKDHTLTIYANNYQSVLDAIQDIQSNGGLQSASQQEDVQDACRQFDEIFSEDYTKIVKRNKYPKRPSRNFKRSYNRPWSF